ncbi:MAG: hypothetical protein ACXADX_06165 [Candidatus Hodarchaeales archaeon]
MNSKVIKVGSLMVCLLFLLSMGGSTINTTPVQSAPTVPLVDADPNPGDTHIYNITTAEFPLDVVMDEEGIGLEGTFEGSQIFVKILRDESSPEIHTDAFHVGMFFVLGSDLTVRFQPNFENYTDIPSELREIVIPEGLAVPIGESLSWNAGSGFWPENNDTENEDDYFIPVYAENFDLLAAAVLFEGGTVVSNTDSELTVSWDEEDDGDTVTLTMTWRKSDGLLTAFSVTTTDGSQTVTGTAEYVETKNRPLPSEIAPGNSLSYAVTDAELDLEVSDFLRSILSGDQNDPDYEQFNPSLIEAEVAAMQGVTVLTFTVNSIDGVFYNGTPRIYDQEEGELTTPVDWIVINGLTGAIVDSAESDDEEESTNVGLLQEEEEEEEELQGFIAPAVTPDWELMSGLVDGAGAMIGTELLAFIRSSDFEDLLLEGMASGEDPFPITGMDYEVDLGVDWTTESGIHYASAFVDFSGGIEAYDADTDLRIKVDVEFEATGWLAFQTSGIFAGAGISATGDLDGKFESGGLEGIIAGNINTLEVAIKNRDISATLNEPANPGGEKHPEEPTEDSEPIPGFTVLWILLPLIAVPLIARKRLK